MRCPAALLLACAGCDHAFGIEEVDVPAAACGPFSSVRPVAIDGVVDASLFSASADGQLAVVHGTDEVGQTRPIVLRAAGARWEPDPAMQAGLDATMDGATLVTAEPTPNGDDYTGPVQPVLLVWSGTPQRLARYYWTGAIWAQDANQLLVADAPDYDVRGGNVVVVAGATVDDRVRHTVIVKVARDPDSNPNQVLLAANAPPSFALETKPDRTRPLNSRDLELGHAVLATDQATLVYSARIDGQSDLFATTQSPLRDFAPGGAIAGTATADDEVEPWIDTTCERMYFRRIPAGRPSDPGQIYLAE